jgi:NAD(P)-dependent dehydrogenase (short-subunit alcohol dehydrogenase family)
MHLTNRLASPEEIAAAILFLASPEAAFITGVALPVEGGATLGYRRA